MIAKNVASKKLQLSYIKMSSSNVSRFTAFACLALTTCLSLPMLSAEAANVFQADIECVTDLSPHAVGPMKRQIESIGLPYDTPDRAHNCQAILINAASYKPESLLNARNSLRSGKAVIVDFQSASKRREEFYLLLGLLANPKRNSPLFIDAAGAVVRELGADNYQVTPIELFNDGRRPNGSDNSLANVLALRR